MIKKILIANRGEIAVRVIRSCRELGIKTVAVYSEADRTSRHVRYADFAYYIGPSPSKESYLVIDKIIEAAKKSGADAIHPGYGFLSENAEFSDRCEKEGIIFIGPSRYAMETMGDKITARKTMIEAGVRVVPGNKENIKSEQRAKEIALEVGLPVMVKASAGGGGKGMRLVQKIEDVWDSVQTAQSEALASFGDDSVYIEKYIASPHHIEFQVLADTLGNTVHLCERECSVQRRHQKVVEESPSPLMTPALREEMGKQAVLAAQAVNYVGAGTIEFLVDDNLNYYFLEMNTRLQVEHPITEQVIGVDLVKEQIRVANGEKLRFKQEDIKQTGHSIECRIYAEDSNNNFMPNPGVIKHYAEPQGFGVRVDGYVYNGFEIPIFYDPMISKLIVWSPTREAAIGKMLRCLFEYKIIGIKTSIPFLKRILEASDFRKGKYNTHFIQDNLDFLMSPGKVSKKETENVAIIAAYIDYLINLEESKPKANFEDSRAINKWRNFGKQKGMFRF